MHPRAEVWVGGGLALVAILVQPGVALASSLGWRLTHSQESLLLALTVGGVVVGALMALHGFGVFTRLRQIRLRSPLVLAGSQMATAISRSMLAPPPARSAPAARIFTDVTSARLVQLARTPNLTGAQTSLLLEPYEGKWHRIEGNVDDVNVSGSGRGFRACQVIVEEPGEAPVRTCAYFQGNVDPATLQKGANIRLLGRISGVSLGMVQLQDCELVG